MTTFYPGAVSFGGATPVAVSAADLTSADVKLQSALTHRIEGKVADVQDIAVRSLRVVLTPAEISDVAGLRRVVRVSADGGFILDDIPNGQYLVSVMGRRKGAMLGRQEVDVAGDDVSGLVLRPVEKVTVTGVVTLDPPESVTPVQVNIRAVPLDGGRRGYVSAAGGASFTLGDLDPASYLFVARASQPGFYVAALTINDRDVLNRAVDLADFTAGQISVTVRAGAGEITGSVNETPAMIVLAPEKIAPDGSNLQIAYAQGDGSFDVRNVAPGDYVLYAAAQGNAMTWMQPAFVEALGSLGAAVHVDENGHEQVKLSLIAKNVLQDQAFQLGLNFE